MKEYIIHGTSYENLVDILKSGCIEANISKKKEGLLMEEHQVNQIFTQLLYRNLPDENIQYPHWFQCCIVLDKKILKDYPFYATSIGAFKKNFSDAFSKDIEKSKDIFVKSKGNLKKYPNFTPLKEHILKRMSRKSDTISFIHSHEILFNKKIPLKKYCKLILYRGYNEEQSLNLLKISIIYYNNP
jgi:hypothetical protein